MSNYQQNVSIFSSQSNNKLSISGISSMHTHTLKFPLFPQSFGFIVVLNSCVPEPLLILYVSQHQ